MSDMIDVGALDDIPRRGARKIRTASGCVAVFRTAEDAVFALDDRCPHRGGPLSDGIVHGRSVTCPLHNWVISLETGAAGGADEGRVATIRCAVAAGRVLVDAAALGLAANTAANTAARAASDAASDAASGAASGDDDADAAAGPDARGGRAARLAGVA